MIKLLIFLWIFIYPLSDQSIIIAVLALDIAVLWFWQYLTREVFLPHKIKSVITKSTQTIVHSMSSLKVNGSPLHVVFTSKGSDSLKEPNTVEQPQPFDPVVELQIYRENGSVYSPVDLTALPSDILDGINTQLKSLSDEVSKLINFGKRSAEYSDRLFSWIKFVGLLLSLNILGKLITYL